MPYIGPKKILLFCPLSLLIIPLLEDSEIKITPMNVVSNKNTILNSAQVQQKIRRVAFEIYENNFHENEIVLAGIEGQGYILTQRIEEELRSITSMEIKIIKVSMTKPASHADIITINCEEKALKKKCVILIDDVLNTGRTLAFGIKPFLSVMVKKIEVAVLINRSHTLFPIQPKYTGLELSTTLNEKVDVLLDKKNVVYLY